MALTDGTSLNTTNGIQNNLLKSGTKANQAGGELGKDAFLQLLVTQMQFQDPLDPQDNAEYVAQLAQFTSLEQMTNLNTTMSNIGHLIGNMDTSLLVGQLGSMIGEKIRWTTTDANGVKTIHTGEVTAVKIVDGQPTLLAKELDADGKVTGDPIVVTVAQINGIGNLSDLAQNVIDETKK